MSKLLKLFSLAVVVSAAAGVSRAEISGFQDGNPGLQSAGPLAFGPEGVLLIGDTKAAAVVAIATGDTKADEAKAAFKIEDVSGKIAAAIGAGPQEIKVNDMVVNPLSGKIYFSVTNSAGGKSAAAIVRTSGGDFEAVKLDGVKFSKAELPNAPADGIGPRGRNPRNESITDLVFYEGQILVSGLSGQTPASTVRLLAFPPSSADKAAGLEIFHGAHGKVEDGAPVRTFVPFVIDGKPNLLAAYTCTPLVRFPVSSLDKGEKVRGTTVAELGNRNQPLDMLVYKKDGKDFLLLANSARGVMKISTENIQRDEGITAPVANTAGQTYETIASLKGVVQLDRLSEGSAVALVQGDSGSLSLTSFELP